MSKENKVIKKESKVEVSNLDKSSKIFLFLNEIKDNMSFKEIEEIYIKKYELSNKSNKFNIRVIKRFFGVYSKYSKERKEEINKINEKNFKVLNIDYLNFKEEKLNILNEKNKRSNKILEKRRLNFKEIDIFLNSKDKKEIDNNWRINNKEEKEVIKSLKKEIEFNLK